MKGRSADSCGGLNQRAAKNVCSTLETALAPRHVQLTWRSERAKLQGTLLAGANPSQLAPAIAPNLGIELQV